MSRIVPVFRIPSISWDLWPHRRDDYFVNRWNNWLTDWDDMCYHMNDRDRNLNKLLTSMFKEENLSRNENLPHKIGWRVTENAGDEGKSAGKLVQLDLPVKNFKPDEINVQLKDRTISIEAKHQHENDGEKVYRETKRSFTLPEGVQADDLKCHMNPDGILTVTAPAPKAILDKKPDEMKNVPIDVKK